MIYISGLQKQTYYDNTISAAERTIENLISTLETEIQAAIEWFKLNELIFNPEKSQPIVVKKNAKMKDSYPLNINDRTIDSENSVKLLGIEIDNNFPFEQHISTLYNKLSNKLNAIGRIQKFMGFKEKNSFLIVFYTQILIIVVLFGIFDHLNLYVKSEKYKNRHFHYTTTSVVTKNQIKAQWT